MKLTLENGAVIDGDLDEIKEFLEDYNVEKKNDGPLYLSETIKDFIPIRKMTDYHLINAVSKIIREDLELGKNNILRFRGVLDEIFGDDQELADLIDEIRRRTENE